MIFAKVKNFFFKLTWVNKRIILLHHITMTSIKFCFPQPLTFLSSSGFVFLCRNPMLQVTLTVWTRPRIRFTFLDQQDKCTMNCMMSLHCVFRATAVLLLSVLSTFPIVVSALDGKYLLKYIDCKTKVLTLAEG